MIKKIHLMLQAWYPEPTADELAAKALKEARTCLLTAQAQVEADKVTQADNLARLAMYEERVKRLASRKPDEPGEWVKVVAGLGTENRKEIFETKHTEPRTSAVDRQVP